MPIQSPTPTHVPMHAMVLAAGRGERMRPLTDTTPKPLLSVKGKPLLQWHLEALAAAGFESVVINVAYLGQQIQDFAKDGKAFGLTIRYSVEPDGALETAGGIAHAAPWENALGETVSPIFLVVNADIWTDWPREKAHQIQRTMHGQSQSPLCHLVLVDNPAQHPDGDFGLDSGRVIEKNTASSLTFSGIGVYDHRMFNAIPRLSRAPLAPLLHQSIGQQRCTGEHHRGIWSDVGTPDRLAQLNT
jgi:N-acetyl-alpha-D-muramate 1-phosphate uridylyltransferase